MTVRVRFAPSPTGYLHIGGLRSALFNYLFAKHHNGTYLLRIEDTDLQRNSPEYTQAIFDAFEWIAIQPDEPAVIQSERFPEHTHILYSMLERGSAYKCYCSPQELLERLRIQGESDEFVLYDGFCRSVEQQKDAPFVIRFKRPLEQKVIQFNDLIRGEISWDISQFDDFILARPDGRPMYNFVVVVDDAFMKITHIIRGEEHLSNTPKQIMLYQALGYSMPQFAHLPLILGPSGNKLSKREAATNVMEYKENGYLPQALLNYLARLGWAYGDQEIFSLAELIEHFTLDTIGKKGAIFDQQKLNWVNSVYLRAMSAQEIVTYLQSVMDIPLLAMCNGWQLQTLLDTIDLYKERCSTLKELVHAVYSFYNEPQQFDQEAITKWVDVKTADHVCLLIEQLEAIELFSADALAQLAKEFAKKEGIKMVSIAQPVRIAMIGSSDGPGAFHLVALLGKKEAVKRLRALYDMIKK